METFEKYWYIASLEVDLDEIPDITNKIHQIIPMYETESRHYKWSLKSREIWTDKKYINPKMKSVLATLNRESDSDRVGIDVLSSLDYFGIWILLELWMKYTTLYTVITK